MCILHIHTCISCFNLKKLGIVLEIFLVQMYLTRDGSTPEHSKIDMPRVVVWGLNNPCLNLCDI